MSVFGAGNVGVIVVAFAAAVVAFAAVVVASDARRARF